MLDSIVKNPLVLQISLIILILIVMWVVVRVNRKLFREFQKKQGGLHLRFFERISTAVILVIGVILIFSIFGGVGSIWKSLLGGTAIISAVLAVAAQDAIRDILAGFMISLYKPFEIDNRIMLEDGTAGIVKDITMRHVVLLIMDTQYLVIPNSKLNQMYIRNFSYHAGHRSALFQFRIAYGSDVERAMEVIKEAVMESEYSIPGRVKDGEQQYSPVYFMAYEESSLRMETTVYYEVTSPSEVVISDINRRVNHALKENGIEIPYAYINVIRKDKA